MKWFKHFTKALSDAKIEKVIMKYGIAGYGLYFACLEIIAGNLSEDNITFELEHDAEVLAYKFKLDQIKTQEMMKYMIDLGLFELNEITGRITCMKLAQYIDSSLIKNPKLAEIKMLVHNEIQEIRENSRKFEKSPARLDKIRLDKINKRENTQVFGELKNVLLTLEELDRLNEDYGAHITEKYINKLSTWDGCEKKKDHNRTIRNWLLKDNIPKNKPKKEFKVEGIDDLYF